jgi:[ribosomal protein S18]-alanine N-acetyltransferase
MRSTMLIRSILTKDLPSIFEIENQSFGDEAFNKRQFRYLAKSPTCHFVVADIDNQIGGYLLLNTRRNSKTIRIYSLATNPNYRGQGIGEKLMNYAKDFAKEHCFKTLSLEVSETNNVAVALYNKMGFTNSGKRLDYYGPGRNALVMRHIL